MPSGDAPREVHIIVTAAHVIVRTFLARQIIVQDAALKDLQAAPDGCDGLGNVYTYIKALRRSHSTDLQRRHQMNLD